MELRRRIGFWLIAFACAYAIWLIHDDSAKLPELLAGVLVAALAATATELVREQRVAPMGFRLYHFARAWKLVPASVRDGFTLTRLVFAQLSDPQPVRGHTAQMPFSYGGDEPEQNARRAVALGLGSFAPGTVVIG